MLRHHGLCGNQHREGVDMKKNPLVILSFVAAVAAAAVLGACSWELPEEVVFRAQPQLWIPTGDAVFDLEVSDDIIDEFTQSVTGTDPNLTAGEKEDGLDGYDGRPLTLYAELDVEAPTFPDPPPGGESFDVFFEDQTDPIDLSGAFGPVPAEVQLFGVPGWAWFEPVATASPPYPGVSVRLRAEWNGGAQTQYLLGTAGIGGFVSLASSRETAGTFDLTAVFNARPEDLVLHYEFGANSAQIADIDSLHLRLEVPFAFDVTAPALLDFTEDGNNPLAMEEDIFGRDPLEPDEDLNELLESLRGSSAGISMHLTHTTGLGAHLGMINLEESLTDAQKKDRTNWVIDAAIQPDETEQDFEVEITADVLDQMIDAPQFVPEFLVLLEDDFQINSLWEITVTRGYLHVQAVFDYNFSLEDDE
jgi:hypothetical protein